MNRVPLSSLILLGVAILLMVDSCSARADLSIAEAAIVEADREKVEAVARADSIQRARLEDERADSLEMAQHADSVAARAVADALSRQRSAEARRQRAAARITSDSLEAVLVAGISPELRPALTAYVASRDTRESSIEVQVVELEEQLERSEATSAERLSARIRAEDLYAAALAERDQIEEALAAEGDARRLEHSMRETVERETRALRRENGLLKLLAGAGVVITAADLILDNVRDQ